MNLIKATGLPVYKPKTGFKYPWAYEIWEQHDAMVWHKSEYDLSQDVIDFSKADESEKWIITNIMKLFTENDTVASTGYAVMLRIFKPFEVYGMLSSFNDREITHTHNYANFTETIGLGDDIYSEFLEIPVMETKTTYIDKAKVKKFEDYKAMNLSNAEVDRVYREDIAKMLAVYAGGLEGTALMAQFAMLLIFQAQGKYPGLCTIVEWSVKDEMMHLKGNAQLFRSFIEENLDIWNDELKYEICEAFREIVAYEHALIDYLNPKDKDMYKRYVEYMADNALNELGMKKNWNVVKNPIPFMEDITGIIQTDFFSGRVTEYSKTVDGSWDEIDYSRWLSHIDTQS
ncbi:MAG: ribonucleotide-diphosphate reductase subunit beta [Prevotella sp.]